MKTNNKTKLRIVFLPAFAAAVLFALPASAELILSAQNATALAGASNASFEVDLTNTGSSAVTIGAFSFGLTAPAQIVFESASITTTLHSYIFDTTDSFDFNNGFSLNTTSAGTTPLLALDNWNTSNGGFSLGAGNTIGLGEVYFDVDPAATPGSYTVAFEGIGSDTSLADAAGGALTIDATSSGAVTVNVAVAPEPATASLMALALAGLALAARKHRAG